MITPIDTRCFPQNGGLPIVWAANFQTPPNIMSNYASWQLWKNNRIAQFSLHCPLRRATTYYFSQSGDDSTGDGSQDNPYKTLAKAQSISDASSGDIALLFKRGDVWSEVGQGLAITKNNTTVADYGTGALPLFNLFTKSYVAVWSLASGNRYTVSETSDIAWLRDSGDRLGEIRSTNLIRMTSSLGVEATSYSWWWDSGTNTLHVNMGGENPNSSILEAVISNSVSGVSFSGDGCRCENIRADGYGCHRTTLATQKQPFTNISTGDNANLFKGCEGYYSGSHVIAHYNGGSSGGRALFLNCIAGFAKYNSFDEPVFNAYSNTGEFEVWFVGCVCKYGVLKSSDWSYSTLFGTGTAFNCHTSGTGEGSLYVVADSRLSYSHAPADTLAGVYHMPTIDNSDLSTARAFFDNCLHEDFSGNTADVRIQGQDDMIFHRCKWYLKPLNTASDSLGTITPWNTYFINCYIYIDLASIGTDLESLFNATGSTDNRYFFYHTNIILKNAAGVASARFGIDYDVRTVVTAPGSGIAANSKFINSVLSVHKNGGGDVYYFAVTNQSSQIKNNGYYQVTQATGVERGYDNDAGKVILTSEPVLGTQQSELLQMGSTTITTSHDLNGKRRTSTIPDIGCEDFSS